VLDLILAKLMEDVVAKAEGADLAALADRLLEVDAADRLEFLRRWADAARRLKDCQHVNAEAMQRASNGRCLRSQMEVHDEYGPPREHVKQNLQRQMANTLLPALEYGRCYALRLVCNERHRSEHNATEVRLEANVVPLDGGRITVPEEQS
jgi:hypothetical protein